jgi:two-component system, NarL family, sensor kinase
MKFLLTGFFALALTFGYCQNDKSDSLQTLLIRAKSDSQKVDILNQLSATFLSSDFKKALDFALQAQALAETSGNRSGAGKSLLSAGMANYFQGNFEKSIACYLESLDIYEHLSDTRGIILVLNELGTLEKKNEDIKNSEQHLLRALDLSHSIQDSGLIAHSMNNVGHVYELQNDLTKAMEYYMESAVIKEKLNDLYGAAFNYDNMGNILSKQGKYDEAKKYFEKEIRIFSGLNDRMAHAIAINNMGEMFNMKGDYVRARTYLFQSLAVSRQIGYKDLSRHIYNVLSDTYRKEKNFEKAYDFFVQGVALKDSLYNEQKSKQLQDLQTRYDTEKKENEIVLLRQENEIKEIGLRQNRIFILGLIVVLLALLLVGYLWQNRTRLKQKAELESTRAALRESQLQAVIASQEEERKRFAADLHDGLGQIISALRLNLSKDNPEKNTVDYALSLLNDMNIEIRNIAFNLMPQALMKDGLEEALKEFASRINRAGKIEITVKAFDVNEQMPMEHKIALYRVCQEWVNNVLKYSKGKHVSLQLVQHAEELVLTIEDDGRGFDTNLLMLGQGNGWKNINSRIGLIKGHIEIDSEPGRDGTTVMITIPSFAMAG